MFHRDFLPPTQLEYVIVTDTHFMLPTSQGAREFPSRLKQSDRTKVGFALAGSLQAELNFHLGDLTQEPPESPAYTTALGKARALAESFSFQAQQVAGNHDVGDKADGTMPAHPVTSDALRAYEEHFGPSWKSFDRGDLHFVVLNSQIMGSGLPEETTQKEWAETDFESHAHRRIHVLLHLPVYLCHRDEPVAGHYDNLPLEGRRWLLGLCDRHGVEAVFGGHIHHRFVDRIGKGRFWTVASTSFTRPGYAHMFASASPPEQGRDDTPKMGLFLVRVRDAHSDVHFLRTNGMTELPGPVADKKEVYAITRLARDLPGSSLGVNFHFPLATWHEIPEAWPAVIRQSVRNDYPMLGCLEMGARHARVPVTDFEDPRLADRLEFLREEGVRLSGGLLWSQEWTPERVVQLCKGRIDELEIRVPGLHPKPGMLPLFDECRAQLEVPLRLSPVYPFEKVPVKQLMRTRFGYRSDELPALSDFLQTHAFAVDRCLLQIAPDAFTPEAMRELGGLFPSRQLGVPDFLFQFPGRDDAANTVAACRALLLTAGFVDTRLFIGPLMDMDRTMDVCHGLLDACCNPRPMLTALRLLNTRLFHEKANWNVMSEAPFDCGGLFVAGVQSDTARLTLLGPSGGTVIPPPEGLAKVWRLEEGTLSTDPGEVLDRCGGREPLLIEQTFATS